MASVNLVEKAVKLELDEIVRFQLITHCHLSKLTVSDADIECLATLGILDESELTPFCELIANRKIFKTTQTVRNCLSRMEKSDMIVKTGPSKNKVIKLNPDINIQTSGSTLLIYKIAYVEPA